MLKDDLLHGAKAAAEFTGLPVRTIHHLTEKGRLPHLRKGAMLFYKKSELVAAFDTGADAGSQV